MTVYPVPYPRNCPGPEASRPSLHSLLSSRWEMVDKTTLSLTLTGREVEEPPSGGTPVPDTRRDEFREGAKEKETGG